MSEGHSEEHPKEPLEEEEAVNPELPNAAAAPSPPRPRARAAAAWLAVLLIIILAGVVLSPFWAPQLGPLLPWGEKPASLADEYAALAARVAAIEQRPSAPTVNIDGLKSAVNGLGQRVEQLEASIKARTAASTADAEAIKSQVGGLGQRVDRLEAASGGDRQLEDTVAAAKTGLQNLEQRVAAVEAESASRKAADSADLQKLQQELARLGTNATSLTQRVAALEQEKQSQNATELRTDAMLALLLAQMREAVEQARPFPAEYSALTRLARDPALAAAAQPLADAARNGIASRPILAKRLAELAGQIATANEPASETDWRHQVLAHLRGLVTIRRVDGPSQTGPEAAVSTAQTALARGDLAGAVAALGVLTGPNAEAAGGWLRMARGRLAVEAALDHLQELLTVQLGSAPPAGPASPPSAPQEPSDKPRTPS